MKKKLIIACSVIAGLLALDLISKWLVFLYVGEGANLTLINNLLYITPVYNSGASFGMLKGWQWFFVALTLVVLVGYTWYFIKSKQNSALFCVTYAFICAGAIGNLVDRIAFAQVRDFIFIKFFPAIFNVADICITVGVILFAVWCIVDYIKTKKSEKHD